MDRQKVFKRLPKNIKEELYNSFNGLVEGFEVATHNSQRFALETRTVVPCAIGIKFNDKTKKLDIRAYEHIMDINKYNDDVLIAIGEKEWLKE